MPIHDWTRVDDGTFHHFHTLWMGEISKRLNRGILPAGYYALAEQIAGGLGPDVLSLQRPSTNNGGSSPSSTKGGVATLTPPETSFTFRAEINEYTARQRNLIMGLFPKRGDCRW
jgi:hypothetical protein